MRKGFTLIELLVVIFIISMLASMLSPALQNALQQSYRAVCFNNMRQMNFCFQSYLNDWNFAAPARTQGTDTTWYGFQMWYDNFCEQLGVPTDVPQALFRCPAQTVPIKDLRRSTNYCYNRSYEPVANPGSYYRVLRRAQSVMGKLLLFVDGDIENIGYSNPYMTRNGFSGKPGSSFECKVGMPHDRKFFTSANAVYMDGHAAKALATPCVNAQSPFGWAAYILNKYPEDLADKRYLNASNLFKRGDQLIK